MKIQKLFLLIICLNFSLINISLAAESQIMVTNVTGSQFTISWVTENNCTGKVNLYDNNFSYIKTITDERGKHFIGDTHYINVTNLRSNTDFVFSIVSDDRVDDNNGQFYKASTGSNIIPPTGSFQPAGKVFIKDKTTIAENAIVYIVVSNDVEQSAPLSTYVDQNGY